MDPAVTNFVVFGVFIALMWFLLIRPQQRRQKQQRELLASLRRGDDVITVGGLHGRIQTLTDDYVDLEVTDDVVLRFQRSSVARKVEYGEEGEGS